MDSESTCYGGGSIAGAVLGTLICGIILGFLIWWFYKKYQLKRKVAKLVVEDPENAKNDFAFDNPAFKNDGTKNAQSPLDTKWLPKQNGATNSSGNDKRKTVDDSYAGTPTPRTVALRGSDFTGLGVEICGGLKDGIYVKKVSSRGPAAELVQTGDRITSITIDFRHIVQEDAVSILSYASPYNVQLEVIDGKGVLPSHIVSQSPKDSQSTLSHPLYRSSSQDNLDTIERNSRKKLFPNENDSNYPTLRMDEKAQGFNNLPTVHKENEKEKKKQHIKELVEEKLQNRSTSPEKIHVDIENSTNEQNKNRTSGTGGLKFGIRVLPPNVNEKMFGKSPNKEKTENDNENNQNHEKTIEINGSKTEVLVDGKDGKDDQKITPPTAKRRSKDKIVLTPEFQRDHDLNSSGIKRDSDGIPQEIPNFMLNAANSAKDNRKSLNSNIVLSNIDADNAAKKSKGKAPKPPPPMSTHHLLVQGMDVDLDASTTTIDTNLSLDVTDSVKQVKDKLNFSDNFIDIHIPDDINELIEQGPSNSSTPKSHKKLEPHNSTEKNIQSKIELNSDHITIHQNSTEEHEIGVQHNDEIKITTQKHQTVHNDSVNSLNSNSDNYQNSENSENFDETTDDNDERKTASLGDLSKFDIKIHSNNSIDANRTQNGTLERAQSLEISDCQQANTSHNKKRKATISDTDLLVENKEPRIDHLDSGLDTLQRGRLKSAYEFGTMEDVINKNNDELKREITEIIDKIGATDSTITTVNVEEVAVVKSEKPENILLNGKTAKHETVEITESRPSHQHDITTISLNNIPTATKVEENITDNIKIINNFGTTNISDDVKVSRYPFGSLERPKSDVLKKLIQMQNITTSGKIETQPETNLILETQPISLTLIGGQKNERIDSTITTTEVVENNLLTSDSPVYSSDNQGVNSISISSMEFNIGPPSIEKTIENLITISTDSNVTHSRTTSQPNSIIMIDDEKLDFTLQTPPDHSDNDDTEENNKNSEDNKTFVTEITVKSMATNDKPDDVKIIQNSSTKSHNIQPPPKPTSLLTNFMQQEKQHVEENFIPRNSEIRFTTSTYEPSINKILEKRNSTHIDQIRSNFETKQNTNQTTNQSSSEIAIPPRKSSIPTLKSPSKIPVFHSTTTTTNNNHHNPNNNHNSSFNSNLSNFSKFSTENINLVQPPKMYTTTSTTTSTDNNLNGNNNNVNRVSVSVTSIKNSSRHPSESIPDSTNQI